MFGFGVLICFCQDKFRSKHMTTAFDGLHKMNHFDHRVKTPNLDGSNFLRKRGVGFFYLMEHVIVC